ncbi:MAG: iron ABC transporter permease [archaeon]|nr:iron ABC transporter permease [archaeon]
MGYVKERLGNLSTLALVGLLGAFTVVAMIMGISIGAYHIDFSDVWYIVYHNILYKISFGHIVLDDPATWSEGVKYVIVINMRAPRVIMAAVVGASLAIAGVVMQATVQNPLADPYILGMSSGASLGATVAIAVGVVGFLGSVFGKYGIASMAFAGSFFSAMAVLILSSAGGRTTSVKLVLSGTIISSLFGAVSNLIVVLFADKDEMQEITFWLMGSFGSATWEKVGIPIVVFLISAVFMITQVRHLNTMLTGDEVATTLGIDLSKKRRLYVVFTALLTATSVCFCGMIGFVGLIIPHVIRGLTGTNHWKLLPVSAVAGGFFMVVCDVLCRTIIPGSELPIGILTAFCGAPVFAYIMIRRTYNFGGN